MSSLPDPEAGSTPISGGPPTVDQAVARLRDNRQDHHGDNRQDHHGDNQRDPEGDAGRDNQRRKQSSAELMEFVESRRKNVAAGSADPTPPQMPGISEEFVPGDPTPTGAIILIEPRRRVTRTRIVLAVFAMLAAYYLVSLYQVWSAGRADELAPVDAIVVMGAAQYDGRPSPQLAARLDHVAELWPEGYAPIVVVTGGNIPGDRFTEASASAEYLVERGVPDESILQEDQGSNSFESLQSVAAMLDERGLDDVLIVTDPYHALRSRETAEELGLSVLLSSTDTSVVQGSDAFGRHIQEAAGVAIGRIIGFERLASLVD